MANQAQQVSADGGASPTIELPAHRWHLSIQALHWLTLLCVAGAMVTAWARDWVDDDDLTDQLLNTHRYIGLAVLSLTLLRIAARQIWPAPTHALSPLQTMLSKATHLLIYALLLGMPGLGWLTSNAHGVSLHVGPVALPTLLARNHDLGDTLGSIHGWGAWLFLGLVGAHAGAALWHHIVLRDAVLSSMLRSNKT